MKKVFLIIIINLLFLSSCKDECKQSCAECEFQNTELKYTNHYKDGDSLFFKSIDNKKINFKLDIRLDLIGESCGGWAGLGGGPSTTQRVIGYGNLYFFRQNDNTFGSFSISKLRPDFKINYNSIVYKKEHYFIDGQSPVLDTIINGITFNKCIKLPSQLFTNNKNEGGFILLEQSYGLRLLKLANSLDSSTYILQRVQHNN